MENGSATPQPEFFTAFLPLIVSPQSNAGEEPVHITPMCRTAPAVQSHWSPSSLDLLETCPRKYYYSKIERWGDKDFSPAPTFGTIFHKCMEYNAKLVSIGGVNYEEALAATVRFAHNESQILRASEDTARTPLTLVRAVVWYLEDNRYSPIRPVVLRSGNKAVELDWELVLPLVNPDGEHYTLRGHIDQVVDLPNGEGYAIEDYKTTKSTLSSQYWHQFKPSNQSASYNMAGRALFFDAPAQLEGPKFMIRAVQTMVNGTRFGWHVVTYSLPQIEEFIRDTLYWISKAEEYAEMQYWPMNRTACDSKGGCWFRDVCAADPSVRQVHLQANFKAQPNVYEAEAFRRLLESIIPQPSEGPRDADALPSQPRSH